MVKMNSVFIKTDAIEASVKLSPVKYNMGPNTAPKIPTRKIKPSECLLATKDCLGLMYINKNEIPITRYIRALKRIGWILVKDGLATAEMEPYRIADKKR
jgi:hypothetical protein